MLDKWQRFAQKLQQSLLTDIAALHREQPEYCLQLQKNSGEFAQLHLTPFQSKVYAADAAEFFQSVSDCKSLIAAYRAARQTRPFEETLFPREHLSEHAQQFVLRLLNQAEHWLSDSDAVLVADWVKQLDVYTAVKAIESLLNSRADLTLLRLAREQQWQIHFDHLAIRCGRQTEQAAEKVADMLRRDHGYHSPQIESEAYYVFADGWNAYPLYKMLDNGQVLRLFIDQSERNTPAQIIQHWNHIYGFTAHHLGLRATRASGPGRLALTLDDIIPQMQRSQVEVLTPTGMYTQGLLQQVFTKPEHAVDLPPELLRKVSAINPELEKVVKNAKLLEIVSRREMPEALKAAYFALYDIDYQADNALHSAVAYQYFLPAQAAHVIKTSVQA